MPPSLSDHLASLFAYDLWADRALADALGGALYPAGTPPFDTAPVEEAARLFAHLTRASEVWLGRVEGTEAAGLPVWPSDPDVPASLARAERAAAGWRALFHETDDLGRTVAYATSRGERFGTALSEIAAHVVNHGTHHRGQAVRLLREAGLEPPVLDLIAYVREPGRLVGADRLAAAPVSG